MSGTGHEKGVSPKLVAYFRERPSPFSDMGSVLKKNPKNHINFDKILKKKRPKQSKKIMSLKEQIQKEFGKINFSKSKSYFFPKMGIPQAFSSKYLIEKYKYNRNHRPKNKLSKKDLQKRFQSQIMVSKIRMEQQHNNSSSWAKS